MSLYVEIMCDVRRMDREHWCRWGRHRCASNQGDNPDGNSTADARREAKRLGWKVGPGNHAVCPGCQDQPTPVIPMTAKTLIERLTAEAKLIREHVPNEDSAHHIVAGPAHADLLEASAQFAQTQADTIEVLLARVAELQDALKAAALRFELIANGCSEETANPRVGAQEARAILTKSKGELQP